MTTPSTERKAGPLLGTGAQTTWPFTFKVFAATDIAVTIADSLGVETALTYGVDYTVTLNANQETSPGGTVTYPISGSPLPGGKRLVIFGNLPYDQPLDLPAGGNFSPLALENQLDRLTMQIQQLRERLGRALQVSVTTNANATLPAPSANNLIGWDGSGSNLQNVPLADIATALAFATYRYDTFTGNGVETQFTLSADPAVLGNLDIAVGGVTQTPGTDYTLVSGVLVFSSAPPPGATILARYGEGLPPGAVAGANDVSYTPSGTGAVTRTVEKKLRDSVSVFDFMTPAQIADVQARTYLVDTIDAIEAAIAASPSVYFPPGGYLISRALALTGNLANARHLYGSQTFNTTIKRTTTNAETIAGLNLTCVMYIGGLDHVIENFYVVGVTGSVDGVVINCARTTISNVWSEYSRRGFYAFQPYICIFDRLIAKNASETAFDFATSGVYGKTSLAFTNCGVENCGNGFLIADAVYSSMTACFADYVNYPMPGNPYGVGYGSKATPYGVYHFNKCDITLNGCGVENSFGNGVVNLGQDGGNSVVINTMTAFEVKSEYVPTEWATRPNWAVGPIQTGFGPNSLQVNGGRWNWQNTVVPVSYPTKPVASLVAFNFDSGGYPGRKNIMVNVAGTLIPDDNTYPFAGQGNYFEFCRSSWNTQPKYQFKLSGSGSVITIPIVSQSASAQRHVIKILGVTDDANFAAARGTEATINFASLTSLLNIGYWNDSNIASVTASGMNLQITLTSSLVNPLICIEVLSTDPELVDLKNITIS